jgi:hypothetical protein
MRTKTIIAGLRNNQRFRVMFKGDGSENDFGLYLTVTQMTEQFATYRHRVAAQEALEVLAEQRRKALITKDAVPQGLVTTVGNLQVQVDLM